MPEIMPWQDHLAIVGLVHRYAECFDSADFEGLADLFAPGGRLAMQIAGAQVGPGQVGREALIAGMKESALLYDGRPNTHHVVSNSIIEPAVRAGEAHVRSYFTVFQSAPDLPLQAIAAGRYHDRLLKLADRWLFGERLVLLDLSGDLSRHVGVPGPTHLGGSGA